ncbi:MAG: class I SAM-dependent methyltransferase [Fidelibacterota bacterium]
MMRTVEADSAAVSMSDHKIYDLAARFYRLVEREVNSTCDHLSEEQATTLRTYYQNLIRHSGRIPYYRHNWARRLMAITKEILTSNGNLEILDVGCGEGTESIFFATLRDGVAVWGIDCCSPRLFTAQRRKTYYEKLWDKQLGVSFHNGDVFSIPGDRTFDFIWIMEAISHIHPAESFIEKLPHLLRDGGIVAISDSNLLNPLMIWMVLRLRWKGIYFSRTTLRETGQVVEMVEERLFTPYAIERKLLSLGFTIKTRTLGGFFHPAVGQLPAVAARLNRLENICQKVPGLASLAGIYTVVAQKPLKGKNECAGSAGE